MLWNGSETASSPSFSRNKSSRSAQSDLKARFIARYLMLSIVPQEIRIFIGDSTTTTGVTNVAEALNNPRLNRRLWYVIFERLLVTAFPNNRFNKILSSLHSKSPRGGTGG